MKYQLTNKTITKLIKQYIYPENSLIPLDTPFVDDRGVIQNLITNGIESVAVITSKKGSIRSNHWHQFNSHHLYIVSGSVEYFERNLDGMNRTQTIYAAGQMFFTPPNKVHKVVAIEDTIMISLAPKSNAPEEHDEDTIKEDF